MLMAIGFLAAKLNIITKETLTHLSNIIVKIILPALIFSVVAGSGVQPDDFLISGRFALGVLMCYSLLFISAFLMSKVCMLKGETKNVFIALASFGNMGFMGIPLIQSIFQEPVTQVCISVYTIIDMALLWTVGVYLCSRHQKNTSAISAAKNMVNPTTIALLTAFILLMLRVPIPRLITETISGIGSTSKYLTLMYLGASLAYVSAKNLYKRPSIFALTGIKMIILPVLVYFLLGFFITGIPRSILTLIVGLPSMTTVAMVAAAYKSDEKYATEVIFVTTLASMFTIPLVSLLTSTLF